MSRARAGWSRLLPPPAPSASSCRQRNTPNTTRPATPPARPPTSPPRTPADGPTDAGHDLVVPSDSDKTAVVLYPIDPSARLIGSQLTTLVNAAGDTTRVKLVPSDSQECGDAAVVHLAGGAPPAWSIGLVGHSAKLLRLDSI